MLNLTNKSNVTHEKICEHEFKKFEINTKHYQCLVSDLIALIPQNYIDPNSMADTLENLGKTGCRKKLKLMLPKRPNLRSGDLGEIIATDYIEEQTSFDVPIRKLQWRDSREVPMRGDDVIGIQYCPNQNTIKFLKAEAKSNKYLLKNTLEKSRQQLDQDGGYPCPHALTFVCERLKKLGKGDLANKIERAQLLDGLNSNQVEHLLFTVTQSDPASMQKKFLLCYNGNFKQTSIGLKVSDHQKLVSDVFSGVLDGLNN